MEYHSAIESNELLAHENAWGKETKMPITKGKKAI